MGITFVELDNKGFEANDSFIEIWLLLLVDEINCVDNLPAWMREMREEWLLQATEAFDSGVDADLDRFAKDPERRAAIIILAIKALTRLRAFGPILSKNTLNDIYRHGKGGLFQSDLPATRFIRVGENFIRLLQGTLPSEEYAQYRGQD